MPTPYLTLVRDFLEQEGMDARIVPAIETEPVDQLVVPIPRDHEQGDDQEGDWEVSVLQLPDMEEDIESASAVQFYVPMPFSVIEDTGARGELARLLAQINNLLALVGFSYREVDGQIVFRHMAIIPDSPVAWTKIVFETVFLVTYHVEQFVETIEKVASGRSTFAEAARESGDPRLAVSAG